jgi:hypothetical protein
MRRKPDSRYRARTDLVIRRPAVVAGSRGRAEARPRRGLRSQLARPIRPSVVMFEGAEVVDDFPQAIPVAPRELEVIETYLGALLDDVLSQTE